MCNGKITVFQDWIRCQFQSYEEIAIHLIFFFTQKKYNKPANKQLKQKTLWVFRNMFNYKNPIHGSLFEIRIEELTCITLQQVEEILFKYPTSYQLISIPNLSLWKVE